MSARTRTNRLWFAVAYLLATGLVQCAHRHGHDADDPTTRCLASCDDSRVHLSGHTSVDAGDHHDDCFACQFRGSHQAGRDEAASPFRLVHTGRIEDTRPAPVPSRPTSRLSCRAPPSV